VIDLSLRQSLTIATMSPEPLVQIEIWGDRDAVERRLGAALPPAGRATTLNALRLMWWEPKVWLVRGSGDDLPARLADALGDDGAEFDVTGAFSRLRIAGAAWRDLIMIGGVFDAESPAFAPGSLAGTVIHHLPVRLDVIDAQTVDAYTPPSYAAELLHHWETAARRLT
jgi:heterotetrameric sarcosine oxidase gamma subunit